MKRLFFLLAAAVLVGCSAPPVQQPDGLVTVKIIQLNDVYEIDPISDGEYGGMARVAHVRNTIRQQFPNTYIFMAGDFLNPSLLSTVKVDGRRLQGKQMVDVMNAMDFDLVTFGNHEFDLKEEDLQMRLDESRFDWTSANTRHVTASGLQPFHARRGSDETPVSDYRIYEVHDTDGDRMKFGVFGVTLDSNPKDYVHYADVHDEAERAYRLARSEADFVLGLTHLTLDQDKQLAERLPELPLIMGGHEHYNMKIRHGNTDIIKADANAKSVYVHTLTYDVRSKSLQLSSELVDITAAVPSDPKVERVVERWVSILDQNLGEIIDNPDEIIHYAVVPWDGTDEASRSKQTNLGGIITRSMVQVYDDEVSAALINAGAIRVDDELEGTISSKDIFRVLLFGGEVLKVDLKGRLLTQVLDFGEQASGTGAYLQRHGLASDSEGSWRIGNDRIASDRTYTVAMADFLLAGLDIPFLTPAHEDVLAVYRPAEDETAKDIRKTMIAYLKSLGAEQAEDKKVGAGAAH